MGLDETLGGIEFFEDLDVSERARVEKRCAWKTFMPNEEIFLQGDDGDTVCFLANGSLRVSVYSADGKLVSLTDLSPGSMFGHLAVLDDQPRSASIDAISESVIISISAVAFKEVLTEFPQLSLRLLRENAKTIRRLTERVYEYSVYDVSARVQAELLRLARQIDDESDSVLIDPAPIHADIANKVAARREAVSRELSRLAKKGLIARQGKGILIKDIPALEELLDEALDG